MPPVEGFIDANILLGIKNPVTAARIVLERARDGRKALLGRVPPLWVLMLSDCQSLMT